MHRLQGLRHSRSQANGVLRSKLIEGKLRENLHERLA
jgi:hypothetical protein